MGPVDGTRPVSAAPHPDLPRGAVLAADRGPGHPRGPARRPGVPGGSGDASGDLRGPRDRPRPGRRDRSRCGCWTRSTASSCPVVPRTGSSSSRRSASGSRTSTTSAWSTCPGRGGGCTPCSRRTPRSVPMSARWSTTCWRPARWAPDWRRSPIGRRSPRRSRSSSGRCSARRVAHSKSAVPAEVLNDRVAFRRVLQRVVFTTPRRPSRRRVAAAGVGHLADAGGRQHGRLRRSLPVVRVAHRAERPTGRARRRRRRRRCARFVPPTCCDSAEPSSARRAGSSCAWMPRRLAPCCTLRPATGDAAYVITYDDPRGAGEANISAAFVTPQGHLRIAFHRGGFGSEEAAERAVGKRRGRHRRHPGGRHPVLRRRLHRRRPHGPDPLDRRRPDPARATRRSARLRRRCRARWWRPSTRRSPDDS